MAVGAPTPVLMMHGFARNAMFWTRWVPAVAGSHRVYRPDLLGVRPFRPAAGQLPLYARGDPCPDSRRARWLVTVAGALGRGVVRRHHRAAAGCCGAGPDREPRALQYADTHSRRDPPHLRPRSGLGVRHHARPGSRRLVPPDFGPPA